MDRYAHITSDDVFTEHQLMLTHKYLHCEARSQTITRNAETACFVRYSISDVPTPNTTHIPCTCNLTIFWSFGLAKTIHRSAP